MKSTILQTESLSLHYGALNLFSDVNLSLNKGELVGLFGQNGSGKSSLIELITGSLSPSKGTVFIDNQNIDNLSIHDLASYVSVVYTTQVLSMQMTVQDVVAIGRTPFLGWSGSLSQQDKSKIEWALEAVGISSLIDQEVATLSDGEKQRVMIAKALAQDTPIIVLDEPTAHLDVKNRVLLMKLLRDLAQNTGKTIVLSTHELEMSLRLVDKAWLITDKKIKEATPEDLVLCGDISKTFVSENITFNIEKGVFDIQFECDKTIRLIGGGEHQRYWVENALRKIGYQLDECSEQELILSDKGWSIGAKSGSTVSELVKEFKNTGIMFG